MLRNVCSTLQRSSGALMARTRRYAQDVSGKSQPPTGEVLNHADVPIVDYDYPEELKVPGYPKRENEPLELRKARLVYQSRKRGMLENDLLLSTFAAKYLKGMSPELTEQYDELINGVSNDWDIYYWATNVKTTPPEYDNEIMRMLKEHVENAQRELRLRQPDLH